MALAITDITHYLESRKLTLVTAESCTAGLVAAMLGDCEGCGAWLDSGFVTYSIAAKQALLGVSVQLIEVHGLTSEAVARAMAKGALQVSRANVAIANTGVAGPAPGDDGTPPGTLCFAWAVHCRGDTVIHSETRQFNGDRNQVRQQASEYLISRIPHYHALSININKHD